MSLLLTYLFKLSLSLGVVFLFYQFVLRRLTFYSWNRWYLFIYSAVCFFIPFIDLSPVLESKSWSASPAIQWVPMLPAYNAAPVKEGIGWEQIIVILVLAGAVIMLLRLLVQLFSFRRLLKKSSLLSDDGIRVYQVNEPIIPFSFGNAIFINQQLHSTEELEEIIRHEFVHVRQRHSADIIWGELLCLINWYNPFAWMIKKAIRQNLEFIADDKVLQNGISKKEYQYMLLKVIGNNQFSIAPKFNFSSLKKRIAMMNKNKSARAKLLWFLFLLPVIAVVLVSFRKQITGSSAAESKITSQPIDTVPPVNSKGYFIDIADNGGNCTVVVKDKSWQEVKRILLNDWTAQQEKYEKLYGEIPSPECLDLISTVRIDNGQAVIRLKDGTVENYQLTDAVQKEKLERKYGSGVLEMCQTWNEIGAPPAPPTMHNYPDTLVWIRDANKEEIKMISFADKAVHIEFRNGAKESYDFNDEKQKAAFAKKYNPTGAVIEGRIPPPPPAPPAPPSDRSVPAAPPAPAKVPSLEEWIGAAYKDVKSASIQNEKVVINYKNGNIESYDLKDANQKAAFEKKYGKVEKILPAPPKSGKAVSSFEGKPDFLLTPTEKLEKERRKNAPNADGC